MSKISNPRRILAVSLADSADHLSRVIRDLTGTVPEPAVIPPSEETSEAASSPTPTTTLAGTTHLLPLKTNYYSASVPIWLDLISSPQEWAASFLSDEAKEVLDVLGGVLVIFPLESCTKNAATARELVSHVGQVIRQGLGGTDWEGVGLAVGVSSTVSSSQPLSSSSSLSPKEEDITGGGDAEDFGAVLDEWEDYCWDSGLEFVHHRVTAVSSHHPGTTADKNKDNNHAEKEEEDKRNEFGEKMGIARVREALEANEWSFGGGDSDSNADSEEEEGETAEFGNFQKGKQSRKDGEESEDEELDPENLDFGFDRADFVGLRKAIWKGGDGHDEDEDNEEGKDGNDDEVKKLERMMHKLQAVRDMTAGMPEEQRKRMAKRAVDEVMKDMEL